MTNLLDQIKTQASQKKVAESEEKRRRMLENSIDNQINTCLKNFHSIYEQLPVTVSKTQRSDQEESLRLLLIHAKDIVDDMNLKSTSFWCRPSEKQIKSHDLPKVRHLTRILTITNKVLKQEKLNSDEEALLLDEVEKQSWLDDNCLRVTVGLALLALTIVAAVAVVKCYIFLAAPSLVIADEGAAVIMSFVSSIPFILGGLAAVVFRHDEHVGSEVASFLESTTISAA